jgi:disulfide bond formation protein DsbB
MSTGTVSRFFALLSLACWVAVAATVVLVVARRRQPGGRVDELYDSLRRSALWLAWIVALVTTLGSLYYSEIAHFTPCKLCWIQRIAMYPLALILLVAAVRRDRKVWMYVLPQALIGAGFAIYHTQLQAFPNQGSSFCTTFEPCTTRFVWQFGFVSLPFMALSAFAFIITMLLVARGVPGADDEPASFDEIEDADPPRAVPPTSDMSLEGSLTP